ncbi:hypothetical protein L9F63_009946, partial [Diploptera punctata]
DKTTSVTFVCYRGTHLRLRPANNTVYNDVCVAQYYADSPVLPVELFGRLYQITLLRVYRKHDQSLHGPTSWIKQQVTSSEDAFYVALENTTDTGTAN